MKYLAAVCVGVICFTSCAQRKFGDQKSRTKQNSDEVNFLSLSPLDLAFQFPFPRSGEKFVVKFSEAEHMSTVSKNKDGSNGELFPKDYFLKEVPQRWYENHAWLYDEELKNFAADFDDFSKLSNDRLLSFTKKNTKLIESFRDPKLGEKNLASLKEKIWNDLYATGIRLEPCFPAIPTSKQKKDLSPPSCLQHAFFMVGQVIVGNKAYGSINILNFHSKEKIIQAMRDLNKLKVLSKVDTSREPIYVHPGFSRENAVAFASGVKELMGNYFGSTTLFGGAFTSKEVRGEAKEVAGEVNVSNPKSYVRKEIWNFAANASPVSLIPFFPKDKLMYPRTVDQLFYINTDSNGSIETFVDRDPKTVGRIKKTFFGAVEQPWFLEAAVVNKELLTLVSASPGSNISAAHPGLLSSYTVDSIEKVNIINENCAICHLPAAARYRHLPNDVSPEIRYRLSNENEPKNLGNVESHMHPAILELYREQKAKQQWYLNMHGFAYGTDRPIVSARHATEMIVISEIISHLKIPE